MAELRCESLDVRDDLRELLNPPAVFAGMRFRAGPASADDVPLTGAPPAEPQRPPVEAGLRPRYDAERRTLFLGDVVLKVFKQPAKNQETLLMAFEEEGWPEHIDDPLPGSRVDARKRLHDTAANLNRFLRFDALVDPDPACPHPTQTVQFHVDGDGGRAHWRLSPVTCGGACAATGGRAPRVALFVG